MKIQNIKVIGIGAGGTNLVHFLGQFLNFHVENAIVTLIDGKTFRTRNFENQRFSEIGNKAEIKKADLRKNFSNVRFRSIPEHIDNKNVIKHIVDGDLVFLGVDNHKTKSIINAHCRTLDNVVLISGGLEDTDGDIWIYIRKNGEDITPDLTYNHPEIAEPEDTAPFEKSCDEVMETEPARLVTVLAVVDWMMITFANYLAGRIDYYQVYIDTATCQTRKVNIPKKYIKEKVK